MTAETAIRFGAAFEKPEHDSFLLAGTGDRAALLVHGFPGTPAEMRPLAGVLHADGWTAQGILLPGFGRELDTVADKSAADWTNAVIAALHDLRRTHRRVLLIGHSLGGALALAAAADTPPDGLILLAPFWKLDHVLWNLIPAIRVVFPQIQPFKLVKLDMNDPKFREGAANFMPGVDLDDPAVQAGMKDFAIPTRLFAELRQAGLNGHAAARRLTVRALILQGQADPLVRPPLTRQLAAQMAAPVTYTETPGLHDLIDPAGTGWTAVRRAALEFASTV